MNPLAKLIEASIRESGMRVHSHGRASLLSEDKTAELAERIAKDLRTAWWARQSSEDRINRGGLDDYETDGRGDEEVGDLRSLE